MGIVWVMEIGRPTVYAFIDSQNLNRGVKERGWSVDYRKLRLYLENKYGVCKAFIFIGHINNNQALYHNLEQSGFVLVFKPTIQYVENGRKKVKGNVDAELVLHAAAIEYNNYDKAIVISGDGDFHCLYEYLENQNKLLKIFAPNDHYSSLLRKFDRYIVLIDNIKGSLENTTTRTSGRSKP